MKTLTRSEEIRYGIRSPRACRVAGITYRQLDYWTRTDLVYPSKHPGIGSGSNRLYSEADVRVLRVIRALLDVGLSLRRIRRIVADRSLLIALRDRLPGFLVVQRQGIRIVTAEVLPSVVGDTPGLYAITVDLAAIYADVDTRLESLYPGRRARLVG